MGRSVKKKKKLRELWCNYSNFSMSSPESDGPAVAANLPSQCVLSAPAAFVSPGSLLKMQNLNFPLRPTESKPAFE